MDKLTFVTLSIGLSTLPSQAASTLPFHCTSKLKEPAVRVHDLPTKEEAAFLSTLNNPRVYIGPPESKGIERIGLPFQSTTRLKAERITLKGRKPGLKLSHEGPLLNYGDHISYREMTNMPMMPYLNPATGRHEFYMMPRSIRNYSTEINLRAKGTIAPKDYASDVRGFTWEPRFDKNGKMVGSPKYDKAIIISHPEDGFIFEDPRISMIYEKDGSFRAFLSGTDYSPHVPGSKNPDVMNRYVELQFDKETGRPLPADAGGKINFFDLSPPPALRENGGHLFVDAKNAVIARNELGQITVRTRYRPDFKLPEVQKLAQGQSWGYGEQVFVFQDMDALQKYDWKYALHDLFDPKMLEGGKDRVRPLKVKSILTDKDLVENYAKNDVIPEKGKGLGPGSAPYRVERRGNRLWISQGKYAPAYPERDILPDNYPMKDGAVTYIAFDHEVRYMHDVRDGVDFVKRHYSGPVVEFNPELTQINTYYADAIQPTHLNEVNGGTSGIADLQHMYAMPGAVVPDEEGYAVLLQPYGISDASVALTRVNMTTVIKEMRDPKRIASGQVRRKKGLPAF